MGIAFHFSHMGYLADDDVSVSARGPRGTWRPVAGSQIMNPNFAENLAQGAVMDGLSELMSQQITLEDGAVINATTTSTVVGILARRRRSKCIG